MDYIEMAKAIRTSNVLDRFNETERTAILLRLGSVEGNPRRLDEVAEEVGMTTDEVRALELRVVGMMRHPSRSPLLKKYIEE